MTVATAHSFRTSFLHQTKCFLKEVHHAHPVLDCVKFELAMKLGGDGKFIGVSPAVPCLLRMGREMTEVWVSAVFLRDGALGMALVTFRSCLAYSQLTKERNNEIAFH